MILNDAADLSNVFVALLDVPETLTMVTDEPESTLYDVLNVPLFPELAYPYTYTVYGSPAVYPEM